MARGQSLWPEALVDPMRLRQPELSKPVVFAIHGLRLTLGIELALAADIVVAAEDARFGQIEVRRGIYPSGGATIRLPRVAGWGNAMRWLLTGDLFDAGEAHRIGLVQEVVPAGEHLARGLAIAETIAAQAPLAVRATLLAARVAIRAGEETALARLWIDQAELLRTEDAAQGMRSFQERRPGDFKGR